MCRARGWLTALDPLRDSAGANLFQPGGDIAAEQSQLGELVDAEAEQCGRWLTGLVGRRLIDECQSQRGIEADDRIGASGVFPSLGHRSDLPRARGAVLLQEECVGHCDASIDYSVFDRPAESLRAPRPSSVTTFTGRRLHAPRSRRCKSTQTRRVAVALLVAESPNALANPPVAAAGMRAFIKLEGR